MQACFRSLSQWPAQFSFLSQKLTFIPLLFLFLFLILKFQESLFKFKLQRFILPSDFKTSPSFVLSPYLKGSIFYHSIKSIKSQEFILLFNFKYYPSSKFKKFKDLTFLKFKNYHHSFNFQNSSFLLKRQHNMQKDKCFFKNVLSF